MRTTIDVAQPLLVKAKRVAAERGTTLSALVVDALGAYLGSNGSRTPDRPFELIVRGRAGARFPTPTDFAAIMDEEDGAALRLPGVPPRVAP